MIRSLTLELHVMDDIETGVFCSSCFLPSAYRVRWVFADRDTLRVEMRGAHVQCTECERSWAEP